MNSILSTITSAATSSPAISIVIPHETIVTEVVVSAISGIIRIAAKIVKSKVVTIKGWRVVVFVGISRSAEAVEGITTPSVPITFKI